MTASEDPVRLAAVGLGSWAGVLASAAQRGTSVELVNCFSRSSGSRSAFRERFGVPREASSYALLLADPDVEGVVLTTPNDTHARMALMALEAGKAVYVDKPIAHTVADGVTIAEAAAASAQLVAVGHSARRLGGHRVMRERLDAGLLGEVTLAEANFSNPRGLDLAPDSWRYHRTEGPGGVLVQLGVHHADTLQYLLGPVDAVTSWSRRRLTRAEIPDVGVVLLDFASGAYGYLGGSWAARHHYHLDLYADRENLRYEVSLQHWANPQHAHEQATLHAQRATDSGPVPLEVPVTDMFREEIEEFAAAIRGRAAVEVGPQEAVRALAVIEAAARSAARDGERVTIDEVLDGADTATR